MPRSDPLRVASAQISGTALAYAQTRRITASQALTDIGEITARLAREQRQQAVNGAAVMFLSGRYVHHRRALWLLVVAGADLAAAVLEAAAPGARTVIQASSDTGRGPAGPPA